MCILTPPLFLHQETGYVPQQFLEELLGDNMALEAEQGLRINESDHRSEMLGEESEGRQQPLALGSRPGCSFSLSQGAAPLALNLLGQPILSATPWGLIQGPFGTVTCHSAQGEHAGSGSLEVRA